MIHDYGFIEHALTSVSALFWFLLSSADFYCDTEFYIRRALRVTDNEVELKFLHKVVKNI